MKHYEYEINLFWDNELSSEEEAELYLHLSICDDCRKDFQKYRQLKEKSINHFKKYGAQRANQTKTFNPFPVISYISSAAAILLLYLLVTNSSKETFITKNEIRTDTVYVIKKIPLKEILLVQPVKNKSITPNRYTEESYIKYVLDLPTIKITNDSEGM